MVDNFDKLAAFLKKDYENPDNFGYILIFQRSKETEIEDLIPPSPDIGHGCNSLISHLKLFIIRDLHEMYYYKDFIISLCEKTKARAYMCITPMSYKKFVVSLTKDLLNTISKEDNFYHIVTKNLFAQWGDVERSQRNALDMDSWYLPYSDIISKRLGSIGGKILCKFKSLSGENWVCEGLIEDFWNTNLWKGEWSESEKSIFTKLSEELNAGSDPIVNLYIPSTISKSE